MGPGFVRRDVHVHVSWVLRQLAALQWGPASFAGMCLGTGPGNARLRAFASMGPGFVRRDVRNGIEIVAPDDWLLQWGPASFAGMCNDDSGAEYTVTRLQWGPASFAGMCDRQEFLGVCATTGFNGARLRSPGCAADWPGVR